MKKFLFQFFQVLCFLQFVGYGQLYAHNSQDNSKLSVLNNWTYTTSNTSVSQHESAVNMHLFSAKAEIAERLIFENIEVEYEEPISKRQVDNGTCFSAVFYSESIENLYQRGRKSLAFYKQQFFVPANKRSILFGVFRI